MRDWFNRLFNQHKLVRRLTLVWACWLITEVVLRVTAPEVIPKVTGSITSIVIAVIGLLATVIAFYQWSRNKDDEDS